MRITLALCLAALALAACSGDDRHTVRHAELQRALSSMPDDANVLIVSFDALRADALGVYGQERDLSPNIDRWSEQAFVFDRFQVAAQATPTSFSAGFTGQYPFRVFRSWNLIETQTLAKVMKSTGRHTFGLFHNVQLIDERNFGQGYDDYEVIGRGTDDDVLERASTLLEANRDRPFFGWVHFIAPHAPYRVRELARHLYDESYEGPFETSSGPRPFPETEADIARVLDLYDGEVLYLDTLFQQVIDRLEELGIADRTVVILTADHGEEFGEHGDFGHDALFEEIVRVPLIIRVPGALESRVRIDDPHTNTDLLPTLAEFTGAEYLQLADGVDLAGNHNPSRPRLLTAMTNQERYSMAVQVENHKLIVECPPPEFNERLFDLSTDPGETTDRILDEPVLAGALFETMTEIAGGDPCDVIRDAVRGADIRDNLDEETIEKLKSLGYIQ